MKTEPPCRHGNQMWFLPEEGQALKASKPSSPADMGIKFGSYPKRARLSGPPCRHGNQIRFPPQERPRCENTGSSTPFPDVFLSFCRKVDGVQPKRFLKLLPKGRQGPAPRFLTFAQGSTGSSTPFPDVFLSFCRKVDGAQHPERNCQTRGNVREKY